MNRNQLLLILLILFTSFGCTQGEKKIKIGYVQIAENELLDQARDAVFKTLSDSGYVDGQNINIIENNAQGDLSMIITILQSFKSQNVDLIITNGTPCMAAAAQLIDDIPVVFTVAFSPEQIKMKSTPSNLYGFYDPLDTEGYVSMMQECLSELKRVGMPCNNSEPNAEYSFLKFSREFEKRGIEVVKTQVSSVNDLVMAGQYLAGQKIDAILVSSDNTVYTGLNVLAKVGNENQIPLFINDAGQLEKGAAISMGIDYSLWGKKSGLKAVELLKGAIINNKIETITEQEITINLSACKKQGLVLPNSIMGKADRVIK